MRKFLTLVAMLSVTEAHAQGSTLCNEHGAVVTLADGTVYYLGNNCDAARKGGGTGKWWLAASAFVVEINGQALRLPFEVNCNLPFCSYDS